ncbi:MAG: hypothetical protein SCK70_12295 [bacterium]|nr:hypothetical protein [bacterium]
MGVRTGYTVSAFKGDWELNGIEISDAPEIGITGPYIRPLIGGDGFNKKN